MPKSAVNREGKIYPLSLRTTEQIRSKIEEAANINGRTLTAEVEFRLEGSFREQEIDRRVEEIVFRVLSALISSGASLPSVIFPMPNMSDADRADWLRN